MAGIIKGAQAVKQSVKKFFGWPVHVATGAKILSEQEQDFSLPGRIELDWSRFYSSLDHRTDGLFGPGWSVPYSVELRLQPQADGLHYLYIDEQGREMAIPPLERGEAHYSRAEGFYFVRTVGDSYIIASMDGLFRCFTAPVTGQAPQTLRLESLEDRNGNRLSLKYDTQGRLHQLSNCAGRRVELSYDRQHPQRVAQIDQLLMEAGQDATTVLRERLVSYQYDTAGQLSAVTNAQGDIVREYAYDQKQRMIRHRLPTGLQCHYEWQEYTGPDGTAESRVARHWTDDGEEYRATYTIDPLTGNGSTTVIDHLGRTEHWQWNHQYQITHYTDALGRTWQCQWDDARQLQGFIEPNEASYSYTYDDKGNLTSATDPLGAQQKLEWDLHWSDLLSYTDAAGSRWEYRYDRRGNLIREIDPLAHSTTYLIDERGQPVQITDAKGGRKQLHWNSIGELTRYTDCSGKSTTFRYDRRGQLARVTDALGQHTDYQTDALGRLQKVTHADGSTAQYRYDRASLITETIDAAQRPTRYQRNTRGMVTARIDAQGDRISYHYDRAHRLALLENQNGESYGFEYDAADQLTAQVGLDGTRQEYTLDQLGHPIHVKQAAGSAEEIHLTLERNLLGQLRRKITPETVTDYQADVLGRITGIERNKADKTPLDKIGFTYDALSQTTSESTVQGKLAYEYDELGNRTATTLPDGRKLGNLYYGSGHLHQINLQDGDAHHLISDFERDDLHREIHRTQGKLHLATGYDALGRKRRHLGYNPVDGRSWGAEEGWQRFKHLGTGDVIVKGYDYDITGELTRRCDNLQGEIRYQYDPVGRITAAQGKALEETFTYDKAANLVNNYNDRQAYVKHNRILVWQDKRYSYDLHGRLTEKKTGSHTTQYFRYNSEHQLVEVATVKHSSRNTVRFEYDALGRRIAKAGEEQTCYLWEGMRLLQEQRGDRTTCYVYEPGSYAPLARIDGYTKDTSWPEPKTSLYYFHNDASGAPEEMTDEEGRIVWQARYTTWGNLTLERYPHRNSFEAGKGQFDPIMQNIRFQGQLHDRETGLHYNTFRYYDPDIGRFTTEDPIGLAGGNNLYAYAPNPIRWIDPWGLCRRGNTATKNHMDSVRDQFLNENAGSTHMRGGRDAAGNELPETYLKPVSPTPGSTKGGSYADMTFKDGQGRTVYVQTVDKGPVNGMSQREWDNATRITTQDPNAIVVTVQKGSMPAAGTLNTASMSPGTVNVR